MNKPLPFLPVFGLVWSVLFVLLTLTAEAQSVDMTASDTIDTQVAAALQLVPDPATSEDVSLQLTTLLDAVDTGDFGFDLTAPRGSALGAGSFPLSPVGATATNLLITRSSPDYGDQLTQMYAQRRQTGRSYDFSVIEPLKVSDNTLWTDQGAHRGLAIDESAPMSEANVGQQNSGASLYGGPRPRITSGPSVIRPADKSRIRTESLPSYQPLAATTAVTMPRADLGSVGTQPHPWSRYPELKETSPAAPRDYAHASHIMISWQGAVMPGPDALETKEEALMEIKAIQQELGVNPIPEKFALIAERTSHDASSSDGGDLGVFPPDIFLEPFDSAVFDATSLGLQPQIIETHFGYHLIYLHGFE